MEIIKSRFPIFLMALFFSGSLADADVAVSKNVVFYYVDHLGSTRVVTNESAEEQARYSYYPFGQMRGSNLGQLASYNTYTHQKFDPESNLLYYGARYYDAQLARFISPDPAGDGLNLYAYVANNPLSFVDPTGRLLVPGSQELNPEYNKTHKEFLFPAVTAALRETGPAVISTTGQRYFGGSSGSTVLRDSPAQLDFALDITVDVSNEIVRVASKSGVDVTREVDMENSSGRARMYFDAAINIEGRIIKNGAGEVVGFDWYKNEGFQVKAFIPALNKIPWIGKGFQLPAVTWKRNFVVMAPDGKLYHMAETTGPNLKAEGRIPAVKIFGWTIIPETEVGKTFFIGKWGGTNPDPNFRKPTMAGGEKEQIETMNQLMRNYGYPNPIQYSE
ncbi:MAG: RHS repeat-associated core domain-containing protein [Deltaproteobacteria bacterium]|nr:RHS repeat-associated core domain-containing protein [Deltaproteobacteria bacterium]